MRSPSDFTESLQNRPAISKNTRCFLVVGSGSLSGARGSQLWGLGLGSTSLWILGRGFLHVSQGLGFKMPDLEGRRPKVLDQLPSIACCPAVLLSLRTKAK